MELVNSSHQIHLETFNPEDIQTSRLLSIKTGGCPENCAYCPQSAHYKTNVKKEKLMELFDVLEAAEKAKEEGATRFCMGAAWRDVRDGPSFERVLEMVQHVKDCGLQVCCTLGMLTENQARRLKLAGLYAYNHNIDTSERFYEKIITTRTYEERLQTIRNVRKAGLTVCTGGIIGMGETHKDRISFLHQLSSFNPHPESITINVLVRIKGTPLYKVKPIAPLDVVRVIATARLIMKKSMIRLSAGRNEMRESDQFLCFFSGANSIFLGEKLLTSPNPNLKRDKHLFKRLNLKPMKVARSKRTSKKMLERNLERI